MELVIGLDIETSGVRMQALDAETKKIISTAISLNNPLPGSNIIDHLHRLLSARYMKNRKLTDNDFIEAAIVTSYPRVQKIAEDVAIETLKTAAVPDHTVAGLLGGKT